MLAKDLEQESAVAKPFLSSITSWLCAKARACVQNSSADTGLVRLNV